MLICHCHTKPKRCTPAREQFWYNVQRMRSSLRFVATACEPTRAKQSQAREGGSHWSSQIWPCICICFPYTDYVHACFLRCICTLLISLCGIGPTSNNTKQQTANKQPQIKDWGHKPHHLENKGEGRRGHSYTYVFVTAEKRMRFETNLLFSKI